MENTKFLKGHTNFETAYKIENYPWGYTLKTTMYVWIETQPKKGDRVIRQTINPKNGRLCAPKASTYSPVKYLYMDEAGHVQSGGLEMYGEAEKAKAVKFGEVYGLENLSKEQRTQYNHLLGINEKKVDEFTGEKKKDYSVKWEVETIGAGWERGEDGRRVWNAGTKGKYSEVKITFDRPDGVKLIEIFTAMKALNQTRLNEVFEIRESKYLGDHAGVVRICCRGGVYLGEISEKAYKNYLASDLNITAEESATA